MQNENASASLASISEVHELAELGLAAAAAAIRNGDITSKSYLSADRRRRRGPHPANGDHAAVDSYLSTSHRDAPTPICPLAALGSEVTRSGGETKAAATEVLEKLLVTLADSRSGPEARGDAIVALATMIGAMTMARIVSDTFLSDEILNRAKDHLHR